MTKSKKSSPMPHRTLGVDPGIDRIGIAIIEKDGGKECLLFSECLKTNPKDKQEKRLFAIGRRVREIIKEWQPSSLAIETLFFNQNTTSAMHVSEARGVILYEGERAELELYEYSPQSVKIAVTGYGKADKIQVASMIAKLVNLEGREVKRLDDELDAIAVGITHLATRRGI